MATTSQLAPRQVAAPVAEGPVVLADHLTKRFGDLLAVDDLSFALDRGTVTGFLGPNGAGKTTTLRMLLHLVQPTAGSALVFGRRYQDLERPAARVGAVLEAADFHPGRSGRDHLFSLALALGRETDSGHWFLERERAAARRVDAVLELVELAGAGRRRVGGYSLGMRQRLGLAAALLGDPDLLILDEPANGLDPEGVRWLRDFLRSFAADGKTVFVSSHVLAEVAQTVDDVIIINKGRLVTISPLAGADRAAHRRRPRPRARARTGCRRSSKPRGSGRHCSTATSCSSRARRAPASARSPIKLASRSTSSCRNRRASRTSSSS